MCLTPFRPPAQAIGQMEALPTLPRLFMRTVISALKQMPKLRVFVLELLPRLVSRALWSDASQWKGFLMLLELQPDVLGPDKYAVLLQLPASVLETGECVVRIRVQRKVWVV